MTNTQNINNNLSDLTLVMPAKEEADCLWRVLEELKNYNFQKINRNTKLMPTQYPDRESRSSNATNFHPLDSCSVDHHNNYDRHQHCVGA